MIIIEEHIVPKDTAPTRLSDYVPIAFKKHLTRKGSKKAIKRKLILVNSKYSETGYWIQPEDCIQLIKAPAYIGKVFPLQLKIIYEDNYLAVILKPPGFAVSGNHYRTIQNALPHNLSQSPLNDALPVAHPVHRLDAATSGLLVVAKTRQSEIALREKFEKNNIIKTYRAVALGKIQSEGFINFPIDGKKAETYFKLLDQSRSLKNKWVSLVELSPRQGRTHQLRIHLSLSGHAILGDPLYSPEGQQLKGKGLFLSATGLQFSHPFHSFPLTFQAPQPAKFQAFMKKEALRFQKLRKL